jgi:hypothetical protein
MPKIRRLLTNFSKGELSPLIEGRPDLAAYFEGGRIIENFYLMRQGGVDRRPGTRFITEVKNSAKDTIILPFEVAVDNAYIIEVGDTYVRFFKNKAALKTSAGGPPVEVASPYTEAQLRNIHFTQSVDVLFMFHPTVQQRKLSHVSDTNWVLSAITYVPPPSFEADTDISGGTITLTPGATSGSGITFTASSAVFLRGDVGRIIIFGASRAIITGFGASSGDTTSPNTKVRGDILDAFPNTNPIAAGSWLLRLSPQATLDPDKKEPVGAQVTLVAGVNAFRAADVGKFIVIYGGLVKVTMFDSVTQVKGEILSVMGGATVADPAAAPAGAWTLEITSWSTANGFPRTGEFYQGRLAQASTTAQKTAFWLSAPDDFEDYAIGIEANRSIEYTIASRALNRLEWIADNIDMFIGSAGSEHRATSGKQDEPLGGDVIPLVTRLTTHGSAPVQPVVIGRRTIFLDRSQKKIFALAFNFEEDGFDAFEITGAAEHVTNGGVRLGPVAFSKRPDPRIYYIRNDGTLVTLTYHQHEKVIGFTRLVTDGTFEAVAVIPQVAPGDDQVYVVVKRTIGAATKRYIEMLETNASEMSGRAWTSLQTDCAKLYDLAGVPTTVLTGLSHLEGKTVDVVADGSYRGTKVVTSGQITLDESASEHVEVGLHYDSTLVTMRPAIEGQMVEGLPRAWIKLWIRVKDTIGGLINGVRLNYIPSPLNTIVPYTGDVDATAYGGYDTVGYVTVKQDQPYPFKLLAVFGEVEFGEHG